MKLGELLDVVTERSRIDVIDAETDEMLAYYDGRNSVDPCFNDWTVKEIDFYAVLSGSIENAQAVALAKIERNLNVVK